MEPVAGVDIIGDVMALMSAEDEVEWQWGGLFTKVDSLGVVLWHIKSHIT
jgi:hypothetical protein